MVVNGTMVAHGGESDKGSGAKAAGGDDSFMNFFRKDNNPKVPVATSSTASSIPPPPPPVVSPMEQLQKLISDLDLQFKKDEEQLTKAYQMRSKALKDRLSKLENSST
jgi:hypothetical protein